MKLTIEQLRHINITAYIEYIQEQCDKIQKAAWFLPMRQKELDTITLRSWKWHLYFSQKGTPSIWYEKYNALYKERVDSIKAEIQSYEDDLCNVVGLADPEKFSNVIKNPLKNDIYIETAKTIDFNEVILRLEMCTGYFNTAIQSDLEGLKLKLQFNHAAVQKALEDAENDEYKYLEWVFDGTFCRQLIFDFNVIQEFARIEFLHRLATYEDNQIDTSLVQPNSTLSKTQFTELVKSLSESGALKYDTEKQAVEILAKALNINITKSEFDRILQKIKTRNANEETIFLDNLSKSLKNWINKE